MTQEELAVAADVSPRTVSDLERGINRTARKDTAGLLADAMGLTGREREQFVATALGKPTAAEREARAGTEAAALEGAPGGPSGDHDDAGASNLGWLDSAVSANFVGRQKELGFLREAWSRATAGHRVLALVGGEPGRPPPSRWPRRRPSASGSSSHSTPGSRG
jgi:transcriptional regulator with XRE-family HTH domain